MTGPGNPAADLVRIVARYPDGRVVKGLSEDFSPFQDRFHIYEVNAPGAPTREVRVADLKAVFFVKDLDGDFGHAKSHLFDPADPTPDPKILVTFQDGEELTGFTRDYHSAKPAFFVRPADRQGNNDRCYVVAAAAQRISLLKSA